MLLLFAAALQKALQDLKYGCISINQWAAMSLFTPPATWGAFGGNQTTKNVGSGTGAFGNPLMYDHVEKCVVWSAFGGAFGGMALLQPSHIMPIPVAFIKAMVGMFCGGLSGMMRVMLQYK